VGLAANWTDARGLLFLADGVGSGQPFRPTKGWPTLL
jgi:hypothetical protein